MKRIRTGQDPETIRSIAASAVLDDRELAEAGKELELWSRARRVALLSRVLHVYLLASIAIAAGVMLGHFANGPSAWIPIAAGGATIPTAWTIGRMALSSTTSLPDVEHRRAETGRLEATGSAVSAYSWFVVAAGALCILLAI